MLSQTDIAYTVGGRRGRIPRDSKMLQLITPRVLGQMLGLAEQTIYNRHSTGGDLPPVVKLGHALRFRLSDVEQWIAAKVHLASPPPAPKIRRRVGRPTKYEPLAKR